MYGRESWTIKKSWALKNWCFWTVVLEKTLESSLDCKEIKPVNPKGFQSWIFIGRTDADVPIFWLPDAKNWLTGKDSDAGKDWRQKEKRAAENEMVGWHHWLHGHEFEQAPGFHDGQGGLACCSPWVHKELAITETEPNWTDIRHWKGKTVIYIALLLKVQLDPCWGIFQKRTSQYSSKMSL